MDENFEKHFEIGRFSSTFERFYPQQPFFFSAVWYQRLVYATSNTFQKIIVFLLDTIEHSSFELSYGSLIGLVATQKETTIITVQNFRKGAGNKNLPSRSRNSNVYLRLGQI